VGSPAVESEATLEYRVPHRKTQGILRLEYRYDDSRGTAGGFFNDGDAGAGIVGSSQGSTSSPLDSSRRSIPPPADALGENERTRVRLDLLDLLDLLDPSVPSASDRKSVV